MHQNKINWEVQIKPTQKIINNNNKKKNPRGVTNNHMVEVLLNS